MACQQTGRPLAKSPFDIDWDETRAEYVKLVHADLEKKDIYALDHLLHHECPPHLLPLPRRTEGGKQLPPDAADTRRAREKWLVDDEACKTIFVRHAQRYANFKVPGHWQRDVEAGGQRGRISAAELWRMLMDHDWRGREEDKKREFCMNVGIAATAALILFKQLTS